MTVVSAPSASPSPLLLISMPMHTRSLIALLLAVPAAAAAQQHTYDGRAGQLAVEPPRLTDHVTIDGVLAEPQWSQAALLTGFSQYRPVDGRPAEDSTEILVWYAPNAIYFGIRAYEPHGTVRATLADRDKIDNDDYVQLILDTFDDRRRAFVIGVNPLGIQADGIRSEGGGNYAGGRGAGGNFDNVDMNPDFLYDSKGRVTDWGYEVEIRLPFKSISYQAVDSQRWGINAIRKVQHSGYEDTWTPAVRANASFLTQSGSLEGLTELHRGLLLEVNPFTTGRLDGAPDSSGAWAYDATPEVGFNVSWGLTTTLALDGTVNPDFSQVEADAAQVTVNERFAVFYPEKRPFFLEGIEQFNTPNSLIYTRQIVQPVAGLKLTGKVSSTNIALLSAVDDKSVSPSGTDNPIVNALRVRRDLGRHSTVGLAYTDRIVGGDFNRVASLDTRLVFARLYYFEAQVAGSWTRDSGVTQTAPLWEMTWDRTGRNWGFHYVLQGIDPDFHTDVGYVQRTGIVSGQIMNRITTYGSPGATIEQWETFYSLGGIWNYDDFWHVPAPLEASANARSSLTLRGGWELGLTPEWSSVAFDPAFYSGYAINTGADTIPFAVPPRENGLWDVSLSAQTPQRAFAASGSVTLGRTAAFFEPAPARELGASASVDWRPTDKIRVDAQYSYLALNRMRDGTRLSTAHIPRLKIEYQLSRPIFFRFVGQYTSQKQDALRDPATDLPILIQDADGVYQPAAAEVQNDFRVDWLFSFHPNPGTVFYAGYGSSLTEGRAFSFSDLHRVSDGFFLKLSYLFRT
jgi:hypothetical protein